MWYRGGDFSWRANDWRGKNAHYGRYGGKEIDFTWNQMWINLLKYFCFQLQHDDVLPQNGKSLRIWANRNQLILKTKMPTKIAETKVRKTFTFIQTTNRSLFSSCTQFLFQTELIHLFWNFTVNGGKRNKIQFKKNISTNKIHYQLHNAAEHLLFFQCVKQKSQK